jgi:Flp pilus assembly protein CpaB
MKGGSKLFVFAGVSLALVAVLLLVMNLQGGGKAGANKTEAATKVTIVEAKADVAAYSVLTVEDLVEREVDATAAPVDAASGVGEVIGQSYRTPLTIGQPLLRANLVPPGLRNDITTGMRAIALPVNEVSAMSGLVQDGDFVDIVFKARVNLIRHIPTEALEVPEDSVYEIKGLMVIPPDLEMPNHPATGAPGSNFFIRDDVGDAGELEAVTKIMLQDIKVLRVVRPGNEFQADGSKSTEDVTEGVTAPSGEEVLGQLIIEVTPAQAELVTFIQDNHLKYQVVVRAKDDHTKVTTTGITFDILATDADWALPWPQPITAPDEEETSAEDGLAATPVAETDTGGDSAEDGDS